MIQEMAFIAKDNSLLIEGNKKELEELSDLYLEREKEYSSSLFKLSNELSSLKSSSLQISSQLPLFLRQFAENERNVLESQLIACFVALENQNEGQIRKTETELTEKHHQEYR
jgi:hypothetical protein